MVCTPDPILLLARTYIKYIPLLLLLLLDTVLIPLLVPMSMPETHVDICPSPNELPSMGF
jgi:hypothetical protein